MTSTLEEGGRRLEPPFRLRTLGDLALYRGQERIGEARRKPLALLAYVAVAPTFGSFAVNREAVASLLWAESAPDKARRTLAQTIYALRKQCGAELLGGGSQLAVLPTLLTSDVQLFREAVAAGEYEQALDLYGGPFLDGVYFTGAAEFEHWVEKTRAQVGAWHREALVGAAGKLVATGQRTRAIQRLREAHAEYPDDPDILERLASAYLVNDAAHMARGAIDAFEQRLRTEYDVPLPVSLVHLRAQLGAELAAPVSEKPDLAMTAAAEAAIPVQGRAIDHTSVEPLMRRTPKWKAFLRGAVAAATVLSAALGLQAWESRNDAPTTLVERHRAMRRAARDARLGPLDSTTIGRLAILPPVNRTGNRAHDSLMFEMLESVHRAPLGSFATAVPKDSMAKVVADLQLSRYTPATLRQVETILARTATALAIQPEFYRYGDSIRVAYVFTRMVAPNRGTPASPVRVEQVTDGYLDAVHADGNRAAWLAMGPLQRFLQSMESCVRDEGLVSPAAP